MGCIRTRNAVLVSTRLRLGRPHGEFGALKIPAQCATVFEYFVYIFSGFAIDRSKKYIKTIKNHMKIDAVDTWAVADPPPPPGDNG